MSTDPQLNSTPVHWMVPIPECGVPHLARRFLGLTFVERRLREAHRWGVSHVTFVGPASADVSALPRLRDPRRCASWSYVQGEDRTPDPCARVYEVELFAIVADRSPFETRLRLDPAGDWREGVEWYRQHIVATSGAGWVAKRLNKPVSLALSTRLANTPLTPNQWSWLNVAMGIASGVLVAQQPLWAVVLGASLFQLQSISDGVDGELAQFRLESSPFGAWLDTFADNLTLLAFLSGASYHVFHYAGFSIPTASMLLTVALGAVLLYLAMQIRFCHKRLGAGSLVAWERRFLRILPRRDPIVRFAWGARCVLKKDFFSLLFFGVCVAGLLKYLLHGVVAAIVVGNVVVMYLNTRYGNLAVGKHA